MNAEQQTVYVVDDDAAMHKILRRLVGSVGLRVETFGSASEFLDVASPHTVGCAILDVRMPGMSGLDLQRELRERRIWLPVIIVSGHADVSMAVRAMKAGAYDFIEKPFNDHELLEKVQKALEYGDQVRQTEQRRQLIDDRIATLTPRERQVMEMVVNGMANKQVAAELGLSEKTIEVHRKHVMDKMQAGNVADLIRMAMRASTIQAID